MPRTTEGGDEQMHDQIEAYEQIDRLSQANDDLLAEIDSLVAERDQLREELEKCIRAALAAQEER